MRNKKSIQDEIEYFVCDSRELKKNFEADWNLNMAFYMGDQWERASRSTGQIIKSTEKKARRYTVNYIAPAVDTIAAKISAPNPILKAIPKTGSTDDVYASRIAEYVATSEIWENFNMPLQILRTIPIEACLGSVIYTPYFNPNTGSLITAEDMNNRAGEPVWDEDKREGRVELDILTPFEAHFSRYAASDEDSEAFCSEKARSLEWVWENYEKDVKPSQNVNFSEVFSRFKSTMEGSTTNNPRNMVVLRTYYKKPCKDYPRGLMVVITDNGQILYEDDKLPWGLDKFGVLPAVKVDYRTVLGSLWNKGIVSQVRSSQKQINKTYSQYMDYINKVTFAAILNPKGNGVKREHIDLSKPANFVEFLPMGDNGGAPGFMNTPVFNPQILDNIRMNKGHIDDIFGVHEISRATAPAGVKTGRALSILDAADDTKIHPVVVNLENGLSRMASIALQIIENTYDIPRMIKMVGKPNARMVKNFKGDKLGGNTDVKLRLRTPLPMNKMAAIDTALAFWREGIIPKTEEGLKVVHKMIEMEAYNVAIETTKDEEQAEWECSILDEGARGQVAKDPETGNDILDEQGNPQYMGMPRNPWDNDEVHIKVHDSRRKEIDFLDMTESAPEVIQAYELHIRHHQDAIMKAQEIQMKQQKAMQKEQLMWQTEVEKAKGEIDTYFKGQLEMIKADLKKEQMELEADLEAKYSEHDINING